MPPDLVKQNSRPKVLSSGDPDSINEHGGASGICIKGRARQLDRAGNSLYSEEKLPRQPGHYPWKDLCVKPAVPLPRGRYAGSREASLAAAARADRIFILLGLAILIGAVAVDRASWRVNGFLNVRFEL